MNKTIFVLLLISVATFSQNKKTTKTQPKKQPTEQPKKQIVEGPVAIEATEVDSTEQQDKTFYVPGQIESLPIFPGCESEIKEVEVKCFTEKIINHIKTNLIYPKEAQMVGIEGRVNVTFDINREGFTEVINSFGGETIFQEEAKRIISLLPRMKPATQKGKKVTIRFTIPITFQITE